MVRIVKAFSVLWAVHRKRGERVNKGKGLTEIIFIKVLATVNGVTRTVGNQRYRQTFDTMP